MTLLKGKTAIITGAGRGIGKNIARLFADQGALVAVHYHSSADTANELAAEIGGVALQADLRDKVQAERLVANSVDRFGHVDILVNNASSFVHKTNYDEETWEDYSEEWEGVFGTTYHMVKAVVPHMRHQGSGRIINFAATLVQRPTAGLGAHTAAKAAVLNFSQGLARELGREGITVNVVSPGMTLTDFSNSLPEADRDRVSSITPLGRLAKPEDVAKLCLFYASDLSSFITGANNSPDGGLVIL